MKYSRTVTKLLPSPYQIDCFDYTKIGCKSRSDCIDKCHIEKSLKECNSLSLQVNVDEHNERDKFDLNSLCVKYFNYSFCENKYTSPDCMNEYYSLKLTKDSKFEEFDKNHLFNVISRISFPKNDTQLMTHLKIVFGDEPDTIYIHSLQQYPIEFVCFIRGVISLWTGFSIFSMYTYGKRFFIGQNNSHQKIKALFLRKTKVIPIIKKVYLNKKSHGKRLCSKKSVTNNDVISMENNYM